METSQDSPTEYARIVDRERREIETPLSLAVTSLFEFSIANVANLDDPAKAVQEFIGGDFPKTDFSSLGLPDLLARGMFAAYKAGHRRAGLAVGLPESDPFFSAVGDWPELELAGEKGLARRFLKIAKDTAKKAGKAVGDSIRSLVKRLKGERPTPEQIKEAVKAAGYLQYDSASVLKTIVETAIPAAYAEGQGAGFLGNPGKTILGFQFVAVLDERTTKYCRPRDSVKLPVNDKWWNKNTPPIHWRCRSLRFPLLSPFTPTPNPPDAPQMKGFIRLSGDKIMPDEMNMPSPVLMLDAKGLAPAVEVGEPEYEEIPTDEVIGHEGGKPVFKMTQVPIRTFLKEAARVGDWYHRGDGELVQLTKSRLKEWHDNYAKLADAGVTPWVPDYHEFSRSNAAINNGRVTGVELDVSGDSLKAKVRLVGSKAIQKMLTNDVSVGIALDPRTAHGPDPFAGEYLHHLALTPNPALPNLSPWARLAASADGTLVESPRMYELKVDRPKTFGPSRAAAALAEEILGFGVSSFSAVRLALAAGTDSGWRTIRGAKVHLDADGKIDKGPKELAGTHYSDHGHDGKPDGTNVVAASRIKPLHPVISKDKVSSIAQSMKGDGWQGRPLLVATDGKKYFALTGTHRIAAAKKSGIDVPIETISMAEMEEKGLDLDYLRNTDDDDKENKIRRAGFGRAADLLKAEIEANEAADKSHAA